MITDRAGQTSYGAAWLSTNSGAAWTRLTFPADHGAQNRDQRRGLRRLRAYRGPAGPDRERRRRRRRLFLTGRPDLAVRGTIDPHGRVDARRGEGQRLRLRGRRTTPGPVRGLHEHRHRHLLAADRPARQRGRRVGGRRDRRPGRHRRRDRVHHRQPGRPAAGPASRRAPAAPCSRLAGRHRRGRHPRDGGQQHRHGRRRADRGRQRQRLPGGLAEDRRTAPGRWSPRWGWSRPTRSCAADQRDARAGRLASRGRARARSS